MTDDDVACLPEKTKRPWPLYYCKLAAMLMHILLDSLKTLAHKSNPTGLLVYRVSQKERAPLERKL